jgi:hypothetical protein
MIQAEPSLRKYFQQDLHNAVKKKPGRQIIFDPKSSVPKQEQIRRQIEEFTMSEAAVKTDNF